MQYRLIILMLLLSIFSFGAKAQDAVAADTIADVEQAVELIITDSPKADEALKYLTTNKADRKLVGQMKAIINMKDEDPVVRKSAYILLSGINEAYVSEILKKQIEKETDKTLLPVLEDGYNKQLLVRGETAEQAEALAYFENRLNSETAAIISTYLESATDESNKEAAIALAAKIKKKETFINVLQNMFGGISLGSILILVALGLSIIYGLAGVINMSHGEFLMIGAYTTFCIQEMFIAFLPEEWFDAYFFAALPISFIVAGLAGLVIERLVIRHLYSRPLESLLATLGISLILIQIARNIFGDLTAVKSPAILSGGITLFDGFVLPYNRLFIIGLTIVVILAMYFIFQRTRLGIKIRAVTQNRNMSACVGISTKTIDAATFFVGSGIAGVAGCALTLVGNVVPNMGQTYIVDSFLVVVTGGVGKLVGCITSGLGIGTLSKVFEIFFETIYGKVLMLALIIFFLQYKPKGLFPDKGRIGDD